MQASDFFDLSLRSLSLNGVGVGTVSQETQLTILISSPSKTLSTCCNLEGNLEKRKRVSNTYKEDNKIRNKTNKNYSKR